MAIRRLLLPPLGEEGRISLTNGGSHGSPINHTRTRIHGYEVNWSVARVTKFLKVYFRPRHSLPRNLL